MERVVQMERARPPANEPAAVAIKIGCRPGADHRPDQTVHRRRADGRQPDRHRARAAGPGAGSRRAGGRWRAGKLGRFGESAMADRRDDAAARVQRLDLAVLGHQDCLSGVDAGQRPIRCSIPITWAPVWAHFGHASNPTPPRPRQDRRRTGPRNRSVVVNPSSDSQEACVCR